MQDKQNIIFSYHFGIVIFWWIQSIINNRYLFGAGMCNEVFSKILGGTPFADGQTDEEVEMV